jgi:two-component system alkaline phosphatase synthesis response regulator PhoP
MTRPHVLVVEDDRALARGMADALRAQGFRVEISYDGRDGLDAALGGEADAILLDVMLPKINGYEICRAVREQGLDVPILMVTAKGQEEDVVLGLNLGADDYVVKPFRIAELVARLRAFLRRRGGDRTVTRFGEFELDLRARALSRNGRPLELTAKEFKLLAYFASRPGCALARETILNAVWGSAVFVTPRSIDRCVATLRAKLEADPHHPTYIQTIRDIGYRFEPSV